jgi:hypothetical protein
LCPPLLAVFTEEQSIYLEGPVEYNHTPLFHFPTSKCNARSGCPEWVPQTMGQINLTMHFWASQEETSRQLCMMCSSPNLGKDLTPPTQEDEVSAQGKEGQWKTPHWGH